MIHVASHAGVVLKAGHNEQVRGARHGVALHDVGAHHGPHVLAVVGGVHLQGGGQAGGVEGLLQGYLPLGNGLRVDGVEGGLQLCPGEGRLRAAPFG